MLSDMKTTVRVSAALAMEARRLAAETHTTLTALVEDALREWLRRGAEPVRTRVSLPTFRGQGLRSGVDLDSSVALLDLMESGV